VMVSTVWSVPFFAVLLLTVSSCPAICKSGGGARVHRALWSRRHW